MPPRMYGGHLGNQYFQINWHINSLEMEVVFLTDSHFLDQIQGESVFIITIQVLYNTLTNKGKQSQVNFAFRHGNYAH
jgi:hypothetical protein